MAFQYSVLSARQLEELCCITSTYQKAARESHAIRVDSTQCAVLPYKTKQKLHLFRNLCSSPVWPWFSFAQKSLVREAKCWMVEFFGVLTAREKNDAAEPDAQSAGLAVRGRGWGMGGCEGTQPF